MNQPPPWPAQKQSQPSSKIPLPKSSARIIIKILLYFIGAAIAWFGFFGGILTATGSSSPVGCFAFSFSLFALVGSSIIFFRKKYYIHCLSWLQYLWWILGTTVASLIALGIATGIVSSVTKSTSSQITSVITVSMLFVYGVSLMWIAHLKPSIAQQVNESVYQILQAMPEKQIPVLDLLTHLQKEYRYLGSTIYQYLDNLEYIEQISIPGVTGIVCRIKQPRWPVAAPPMRPAPVSTTPAQRVSIPQPSHMPVQQILQPPVAQTNSLQSTEPKDAIQSIADQKTATALPIPNQMPPVQPIQNIVLSHPKPVDVSVVLPVSQPITSPPSSPVPPKPTSSLNQGQKAIQIFCCYAHIDEQRLKKLKAHLKPLQRQNIVQIWHDRDISAGTDWAQEIQEQLNTAQIILLLVSADFMDSDYCYSKEMQQALERHSRGEVRAIPIIVRPTDWQITPLGKLQALPKDGKPITSWSNQDDAYLDVARGIRTVVETLLTPAQQSTKEEQAPNNYQKAGSGQKESNTNTSNGPGKYTIKNDGPTQGQVVGEHVHVTMNFASSQKEHNSPRGDSGNKSDHSQVSHYQKAEAEVILIHTRCTQGKLIVTNRKIVIELSGLGQTFKSQTLLTSSLSSVDSKLAVPPLFGKGGGVNLTFRGRGREVLNADLVPIKEAKEIVALLSQ